MQSDPLAPAVFKRRLPFIDRRSLSQAWYSSLRLADSVNAAGPRGGAKHEPLMALPGAGVATPSATQARGPSLLSARAHSRVAPASTLAAPKRAFHPACAKNRSNTTPAVHGPAAQRITAKSFIATVGDARVHVHLRRAGMRVHLVAVCSPRHIDVVRRALADVERTMRSSGYEIGICTVILG